MHRHAGPGGGQTAYSVFPVGNYKFGAKPPKAEKENTTEGRLARIKSKYDTEGIRRTVDAILLVGEHSHPHVLLLQYGQSLFFKLPGGKLKPDEDEVSGLRRKLEVYLSPESDLLKSPWDIGECVGSWIRPNFDTVFYPYTPPHITKPKEIKKVFIVQLPENTYFGVPKNYNLVAVPLFELYDNLNRYGPVIASIPSMLSRLRLNTVAAPVAATDAAAGQQSTSITTMKAEGGQAAAAAPAAAGGFGEEYEGVMDTRRSSLAAQ